MNDAQTWTTIGGFLAVVVAMSTMMLRTVRAEVSSLRAEISSGQVGTEAQINGLSAEMRAEIGGVNHRLDGLDSDVQALTRRVFGVDNDHGPA